MLGEMFVLNEMMVKRMSGIEKILSHGDALFSACRTQQKHAHQLFQTLLVLENAQVKHGQTELKILVSVVRFRPRPPAKSSKHRSRASVCGVFTCAFSENYSGNAVCTLRHALMLAK